MAQKIPATVVTGFLGSGKTTMIREMLQNAGGKRIALTRPQGVRIDLKQGIQIAECIAAGAAIDSKTLCIQQEAAGFTVGPFADKVCVCRNRHVAVSGNQRQFTGLSAGTPRNHATALSVRTSAGCPPVLTAPTWRKSYPWRIPNTGERNAPPAMAAVS